ncbi:vWA domain-containing protein [Hanstruepera flava]|uniref:vWA domain-containing protein n=1 Tax=Hanstruepera flava TaxID=2930218 RepID=UPI002028D940|nr:vWA domain-containing protein [Hanstruepera flava]
MKTILKVLIICACMVGILTSKANPNVKTEKLKSLKSITKTKKQTIKVALLLDTSNSMDGLIDQAKAQLWEIVNELSYAKCEEVRPNLQIALYEYGNDNLNSLEGYIRQIIPFTSDLDEISKALFSLTTNGGNEFCGHVIDTSIKQLNWGTNQNDLKLIFIAGNEPFTQGPVSYKDAITNALEKDVSVNTIFCGDYNQGISSYWKEGADLAKGNYMAINHNQATVHIASPYDDKILNLNKQLNQTYIAYGKSGRQKMALQVEQDSNARGYSEANAVSRTVSKSSHLYNNATWDLVDAEKEGVFNYDTFKQTDLPIELQGKSKKEIKAYLAEKRQERETIQNEIQELNLKRKMFIAEQSRDKENLLENAMIEAVKKQASLKNYQWE